MARPRNRSPEFFGQARRAGPYRFGFNRAPDPDSTNPSSVASRTPSEKPRNLLDTVLREPKKLASVNAQINHMSKEDIETQLRTLRLNSYGPKHVTKKRLKQHLRKQRAMQLARAPERSNPQPDRYFDYLCVIDFECTCEDGVYDYAHEIIEFPAILVKTADLTVVAEFQSYCRPVLHPTLTDFCMELVGVSQAQVDASRPFLDVLDDFRLWLTSHGLGTDHRYAFVTDGPWDMGKFFQMQCLVSGLPAVPHDFRYWINLRRSFAHLYSDGKDPAHWSNLGGMLTGLGMEFEGRPHCGRDDAYNIARIAMRMLRDGCHLRINERLLRRDKADFLHKKRQKNVQEMRERQQRNQHYNADKTEPHQIGSKGNSGSSATNNGQQGASGTTVDGANFEDVRSEEDKDRAVWREYLPYKVVSISKTEFMMDLYEDCETCSESGSDSDEARN